MSFDQNQMSVDQFQQQSYRQQQQSFRQSPYKSAQKQTSYLQKEVDPFNIEQIEDSLSSITDWRNIQDVIKKTFKQLTDTVKLQGDVIQNIDRVIHNKVSRQELQNEIIGKANSIDVNRNIADMAQTLDQKVSYDECKIIVKEECSISNKNSIIEFTQKIDDSYHQNQKQLQKEVQNIQQALISKPDSQQINEIIDTKQHKQQQSINSALAKKVDKSYVEAKFNSKAENHEIQQVLNILENKADYSQIQKILNVIEQKGDKQELEIQNINLKGMQEELHQKFQDIQVQYQQTLQDLESQKFDLCKKADNKELDLILIKLNQKLDFIEKQENVKSEIYDELYSLKEDFQNFQRNFETSFVQKEQENEKLYGILRQDIIRINETLRNQSEEIRSDLDENIQIVRNVASSVKNDIIRETQILSDNFNEFKNETLQNHIDKQDHLQFREQTLQNLQQKVDLEEVQSALNTQQKDITQRFLETKNDFKKNLTSLENQFYNLLKNNVTIKDLHELLKSKADIQVVESQLITKANHKEIGNLREDIDKINNKLSQKTEIQEYKQNFKNCLNDIAELREQIQNKADFTQVANQFNDKLDIQQFQIQYRDLVMEIDKRALQDQVNRINRDQCIINESLCTENIIGRWMWKSGEVNTGSIVPWEVQIVNTLPDNFLWEKDKSNILVCAPGLYEILVGFFSIKKPSIQILVNGEPIISAVNRAESAKFKEHKHSQGQLTGLNLREVIILPQRSRLSIVYNGDRNGEGFMSLKRL